MQDALSLRGELGEDGSQEDVGVFMAPLFVFKHAEILCSQGVEHAPLGLN